MKKILLLSFLVLASTQSAFAQWPEIRLTQVLDGIDQPVLATHAGDGSGRLFIVEQPGNIRIVRNGEFIATPFLDIRERVRCCGERGLLSVAFPPGYGTDKSHFYVNYTNSDGATVISRFQLDTADQADANSEEILLTIDQPFSNHNGGQLAFGPDGFLYIGMGDGGSGGDPLGSGQNPDSLLGKMLRIDVESSTTPYAVPSDNPFLTTQTSRPEIWAYGLRNPWRFSFDRATGDLYIADVGQNQYEEVHVQDSNGGGENYGWNIMEGFHCFNATTCDMSGLTLPVTEYDHSSGDCSITGGYVYRGTAFPDLQGIYFYGDFCSGRIRGLRRTGNGWEDTILLDTSHLITSFGEDEAGNIYLASSNGELYLIESTAPASTSVDIALTGLLPTYAPGQLLQLFINETSGQRTETVDLWVALQLPTGELLFLNAVSGTTPLPFLTSIPTNTTSHFVLNFIVPAGISGTYTFFALYSEPGATFTDLANRLKSNLASQTTQLF